MAAGSVVITEKHHTLVQLVIFAWTSDASGVVSGLATTAFHYTGQAVFFATVPGANVSAYTISILDSNGVDILGTLAARSTSVTEYAKQSVLGAVAEDVLTISVTGAGNAKGGTAYLWIR